MGTSKNTLLLFGRIFCPNFALRMQIGIEQALLSKFENGERVPPTESLIILADFYNVSIDYILGRTDNPHVNK